MSGILGPFAPLALITAGLGCVLAVLYTRAQLARAAGWVPRVGDRVEFKTIHGDPHQGEVIRATISAVDARFMTFTNVQSCGDWRLAPKDYAIHTWRRDFARPLPLLGTMRLVEEP